MRAEKAPPLPVVLNAIQRTVEDLMRLAEDAAAGRVPLVDFMHDDRPGEADAVLGLMLARCRGRGV